MRQKCWIGLLLLLIFLTLLTCGKHPSVADERIRQAQEIWKQHESVIHRAIEGNQDLDQFMQSVNFFSEVAGIEIHVEIFTMGYLPTAETPDDLQLLRAWFSENGDRLYYDPGTGTVRVLD